VVCGSLVVMIKERGVEVMTPIDRESLQISSREIIYSLNTRGCAEWFEHNWGPQFLEIKRSK